MGNFGLNAGVPWLYDIESRALFGLYVKKMRTMLGTFLLNARPSEIILNLSRPICGRRSYLPIILTQSKFLDFISYLDRQQKVL